MSDSAQPGKRAGAHNANSLNDEAARPNIGLNKVDPGILGHQIEIGFGQNRRDENWKNAAAPFGALFVEGGVLEKHVYGDKDGTCILQGSLVPGVGQRLAKNVTKNYLVLLDHDTGEPLDEIVEKIEAAGLQAVIWTTFSHMQATTFVPEEALVQWARTGKKTGRKGDFTTEEVIEYLTEIKKYQPAVFAAELSLKKGMFDGGMKYQLTHAPMTRVRSMFLLDEPYDFAGRGGTQMAAINEWKERYAGFAESLGLTWDRSCVDPSRLMYLPRAPRGSDLGIHKIVHIAGKLLDVKSMPRLEVEKKKGPARKSGTQAHADALRGEAPEDNGKFTTAWMLPFLRGHARDFEAAAFAEHHSPDDVRNVISEGKIEFRCANEDGHSEQKANDRAFLIVSASASETDNGFHMGCQHATCKTAANGDRAWYLDRLCEQWGITDAHDLLAWCPNATAEEEKKQEEADALAAAIDAVTEATTDAEIAAIIAQLAERPEGVATGKLTDKLITNSKRKVKHIDAELKKARKAKKDADDADDGSGSGPPPPEDGQSYNCIYQHWDYTVRRKLAVKKLQEKNERDPHMFSRAEGGVVRLEEGETGFLTKLMYQECQWFNELSKALVFKKITKTNDQEVAPFPDVIEFVRGEPASMFPQLDRIVRVPVFAPDCSLRTERGYHPELKCYLDPRMTFRDVPDVIEDAHVYEALMWLFEATRDFSFSDCFDGNDPLPVRDGSVDADGFPMPNLARGPSSRTNVCAALMQGFMRNVIDGPTPLYIIDKPVAGEGAGFLADVISYILEGGRPFVGNMGKNPEEFKKETLATLRSSTNLAFFDNVDFHIDNPILASAVTAGNFRGRILGLSENADVPIRLLWLIAGKNLSMSAELMRRVVPIKIDSAMEHPERDRPRSYYKHDLHKFLTAHRPDLIWACHVIGRNWFQMGCPRSAVQLESFNEYAAIMGGVLEAAGVEGFLENRENYLGKKSVDDDSEKNVARVLLKNYGTQEVEMRLLLQDLTGNPMESPLADLLGEEISRFNDKQLSIRFGKHVHKHMSGRTYNLDGKNYKLLIHAERCPTRLSLAHIEA